MNQSCFSLGFLSQNSLWKLSTFYGYKSLYTVGSERNVKSQFFLNRVVWRLDLATRLSCEFKPQANGLVSLGLLSCSVIASMTLQIPCMLHTCDNFGGLPIASHMRVQLQVSPSLHNLEHFFTLSHSLPLHDSHLNTRLLIAKIQANLARNKSNKMVDKIQPYNLPLWLFRDKTLKQTLDLTCELRTVEQNSLTCNSRICVALETYEQESPETQQHDMIIV